MAKSVKPKNDTYIDASGIVHNRELISRFLNIKQVPDTNGSYSSLSDNGTKSYQVRNSGVYLYINSHTYRRCVILITRLNSSSINTDVIFKSSDNSIPKDIVNNSSTISITANGQCRGYLYDVTKQVCG